MPPLMLLLHQTFPEPFFLSYLWGLWPILLNIFKADQYSFFVGGFDFWMKSHSLASNPAAQVDETRQSWSCPRHQGVLEPSLPLFRPLSLPSQTSANIALLHSQVCLCLSEGASKVTPIVLSCEYIPKMFLRLIHVDLL